MLPIVSYLQPPLMCLIRILHSHLTVFPLLYLIIPYYIIYHNRLPVSFQTTHHTQTCLLRTTHHLNQTSFLRTLLIISPHTSLGLLQVRGVGLALGMKHEDLCIYGGVKQSTYQLNIEKKNLVGRWSGTRGLVLHSLA